MGKYYGLKIINGEMNIDEVPRLWKLETQDFLDKNGTTSYLF